MNSTMLSQFKFDDDGGLTPHVQSESPGKDEEANWLPASKGSFWVVLRLYVPKPEALEGKWIAPPLNRIVQRDRHKLKTARNGYKPRAMSFDQGSFG